MTRPMSARSGKGAALTAVVLLAVGTIQACGASSPGPAPGPAAPAAFTTCFGTQPVGSLPGPDDTPLSRVATYVDATARHYPTFFTGLSVNEATQTTDVYRIPSKSFDADICAAAEKGVTVRIHDTDITATALNALSARISADMDRWKGTFLIREVGPDVTGYVDVGVDNPTKAYPILAKTFGSRYLKVHQADQAYAS